MRSSSFATFLVSPPSSSAAHGIIAAMAPVQHSGVSDLAALTLAGASELVRSKKVSPVELAEACLQRLERLNPGLNAFITVTADRALDEARVAEAHIQRGLW